MKISILATKDTVTFPVWLEGLDRLTEAKLGRAASEFELAYQTFYESGRSIKEVFLHEIYFQRHKLIK